MHFKIIQGIGKMQKKFQKKKNLKKLYLIKCPGMMKTVGVDAQEDHHI